MEVNFALSEISSLIPWLVWIVPVVGALLIPLLSRVNSSVRDYAPSIFALVSALLATSLLPLVFDGETLHHTISWIPSLNINAGVLADPLAVLMANFVAWISFLIMVYSIGYMHGESNLTRYWFFMLFFIGNMQLIVLSDNFLQLFFGWEGVGLCSYGLIGFWNKDKEEHMVGSPNHKALGLLQSYLPSHAGMKALVTTRIGDIAFLIGLLLLYAYAGTFSFIELAENASWAKEMAAVGLLIPSALFIFGGAIGKSAQFPLHVWLPDAMAGPTSVSALIHAATMVKAGVFLVARVGPIFYVAAEAVDIIAPFFMTIAWIGVFTAFLAATQAMVAKEIKKVLAYSTVSQIGYMMLALGSAGLTSDFAFGFSAGFFHLISHALFKASLFMAAGALIHSTGTRFLNEMGGLRKNMKFTYIAVLLAAASLSGIPPLSGFWSKDAILASVLSMNSHSSWYLLYALALITAVITVFYTFRMVGMVFFSKTNLGKNNNVHEAPKIMWIPYMILAFATLLLGLIGPTFEHFLQDTLGASLKSQFGLISHSHHSGLNNVAVASSLFAVIVGGFFAYQFYISSKWSADKVINSNSILSNLHTFFTNRWYINAIYYKIFVLPTVKLSGIIFNRVELGMFDKINDSSANASQSVSTLSDKFDRYVVDKAVNGFAYVSVKLSKISRALQTGLTQEYIAMFIAGIIIVVITMFFRIVF